MCAKGRRVNDPVPGGTGRHARASEDSSSSEPSSRSSCTIGDIYRAVANPLRLRMLSSVTAQAMSAAEIGRELGVSHADASYHLRVLERAGLIALVERVGVHGGQAKRYRYRVGADDEPEAARAEAQKHRAVVAAVLAEAQRRTAEITEAESRTIDVDVTVAEETWNEVIAMVDAAARLLHEKALPSGAAHAMRVSMSALLFGHR